MELVRAKAKRWGSSLGIIIPKDVAEKEGIKEGQRVEVILRKPSNVNMDKIFGSLNKWKRPTEKILKDVDSELWND